MMEITVLPQLFTVCQVRDFGQIDLGAPFVFTATTDQECSLVCPVEQAPEETLLREDGWRAFRIEGILVFYLLGILAGISSVLAAAGIGIFAISTYNTDYVLVKEGDLDWDIDALTAEGYLISK